MGKFPLAKVGEHPHKRGMEQLINEIERDAAALGLSPQHLLRKAIGASWKTWADWVDGKSTPTLATVDRIRAWVAKNQPLRAAE